MYKGIDHNLPRQKHSRIRLASQSDLNNFSICIQPKKDFSFFLLDRVKLREFPKFEVELLHQGIYQMCQPMHKEQSCWCVWIIRQVLNAFDAWVGRHFDGPIDTHCFLVE